MKEATLFGVSAVVIFLAISIGVAWWHGRYKLGQILFGILLGLLLASLAPTLPTTMHNSVASILNALMSIKWSG